MTVRVSVIGAGWFAAQNHIPVLAQRPDVELDGVCRIGAGELERVRSHFNFKFSSREDYREASLHIDPTPLSVFNAHHLHYERTCAALDAGAHVLGGEAHDVDPTHAWELVDPARVAGKHLVVANGYHYLDQLETLQSALRGCGAIGDDRACVLPPSSRRIRAVFEGDVGLKRWSTTFFGGERPGSLPDRAAECLWTDVPLHCADAASHRTGARGCFRSVLSLQNSVDLYDAAMVRFHNGAVASLSGAAAMPEGERGMLRLVITGSDWRPRSGDGPRPSGPTTARWANRIWNIPTGAWTYDCEGPPNALVELCQGVADQSPGEIGAATVDVIAALLTSAGRDGSEVVVTKAMATLS